MKYARKRWAVGLGMAVAAVFTGVFAGAPAPRAFAAAHTYNQHSQTIRCGVLLANKDAYADTGTPGTAQDPNHWFSYVFQGLNARADVRPYGWDIVNPYAAPYMDGPTARRWGLTINAGMPPRLTKTIGAYWEVFLHDISAEQLANYDVLYMPWPLDDMRNAETRLTVDDREKLRRAVDGGTILWIDNPTGTTVSTGFGTNGGKTFVEPSFTRLANARQSGDPMEALLNSPNALSPREIRQLGMGGGLTYINGGYIDNLDMTSGVGRAIKPVLYSGNNTTAAVFTYGQGAVIITGGAIGREISRSFRATPGMDDTTTGTGFRSGNTGPICGSDARFLPNPELKFLVNILSYRFQHPQSGGGPRHSSGSRQDLNIPQGRKWQYPENFVRQPNGFKYAGVKFASDPVVWNGVLYAATSDGYLNAFDLDPGRDLDGDANPDDGLQNPTQPSSDIIWRAPLPAPCSSLTIGDVSGRARLYGMLANGTIFMADALPRNANGRLATTTKISTQHVFGNYPLIFKTRITTFNAVPGEEDAYHIPAPVWYNGRLFAVGIAENMDKSLGFGQVAEIDPTTLQVLWQFPNGGLTTSKISPYSRLGIPSATPTIAAIPDKGYSGATDIMLLVPTLSVRTDDGAGYVQPSRVVAFPIAVRGERLTPFDLPDGSRGLYTRFAGANAIQATNVTLWLPGAPWKDTGQMAIDTANGLNRMYVIPNNTATASYEGDVRADYDFTPGNPTGLFQSYNARWAMDAWSYVVGTGPGAPNYFMEILTTPVVSASGGIYWVASDMGQGGNQPPMVMGVEMRQQKLGFDITKNPRYLPPLNQPQLTFLFSAGQGNYTPVNNSPLGTGISPAPQPVVIGTPAVDRGILYVAAGQWGSTGSIGTQTANSSSGVVTGFYIDGTQFGLLLNYPVDPNQKGSVSISQRNRFTGDFQPVGYGLFDVDNVSINNQMHGLLTFRSLSPGGGAMGIDLNRPYDIQVNYQAVDLTNGATQPITAESPTLYFKTPRAEGSNPNILKAISDITVPSQIGRGGIRTGVTVAGGNIYVASDDGEIWSMPLPTGLQNLTGFTPVLRPATYPGVPESAGYSNTHPSAQSPVYPVNAEPRSNPVVANGNLILNVPVGLYVFYSPRTLITDANRILEVASAYTEASTAAPGSAGFRGYQSTGSEAVWSLDSTTQNRDFGTPGVGPDHAPWGAGALTTPVVKSLNQPTMAVRVNSTNTLICDTGNNRVVEVDRTGSVVWQCTDFADPHGLLGPNESRTLSSPTSVQRWESWQYDENDQIPVRKQHTLIADYGNNRILEIESAFTMDQNDLENNVLVWVGRGPAATPYQFYQAQRLPWTAAGNTSDPDFGNLDYGRTVASVTNFSVNSADAGPLMTGKPVTPGGSLVEFGGQKDGAQNGKIVYFVNEMAYGSNISQRFPLARPVYFNLKVVGPNDLDWLATMTDGQNIFDMKPVSNNSGVADILVNETGPIVANKPLGPMAGGGFGSGGQSVGVTMAKRLQNGNMLMVNSKTGFVLEFVPSVTDPAQMLNFIAPPIEGTSALTRPVYADRLF